MGLDIMPLTQVTHLGAMVGSTGTELPCFVAEVACRIVAVELVDITGVTAHGTNSGTATVTNKGTTGSGTTSVAARATDTVTTDIITAFKPWTVTVSTTEASREVAAGESLAFKWTEAGSGQDLGGVTIAVHYAIGTGAGA